MYIVCLLQAVLTFTSSKLGIVGDIDAPVSILLLLPMDPSLAFDITLILSVPTVTFSTIHAHTTAFETVVVVFAFALWRRQRLGRSRGEHQKVLFCAR